MSGWRRDLAKLFPPFTYLEVFCDAEDTRSEGDRSFRAALPELLTTHLGFDVGSQCFRGRAIAFPETGLSL